MCFDIEQYGCYCLVMGANRQMDSHAQAHPEAKYPNIYLYKDFLPEHLIFLPKIIYWEIFESCGVTIH